MHRDRRELRCAATVHTRLRGPNRVRRMPPAPRSGHVCYAWSPPACPPGAPPHPPALRSHLGERPVLAPDRVASAPEATMWVEGSYLRACSYSSGTLQHK